MPWSVARSAAVCALLLVAGVACRQHPGAQAPAPLPAIDASQFPAAVREAVTSAQSEAQSKPGDAGAMLRLGMILQAHGQLASALACYARAYALDARRFDTLYYWGHALAANGEEKEAVRRLEEALRLRPDSFPVAVKLAEITRDSARASELNQRHPQHATTYYLLGRARSGSQSIEAYRTALGLFPRYGAAQFALAAELRKIGEAKQADEALRFYERDKTTVPPIEDPEGAALAELSTSAPGLLRRAQRAEASGRLTEAAALHEEALAQDPALADAWINLISLRARLGNAAGAEAAYREAMRLAPTRADAHYNFGVFCLEQKRWPAARAAFRDAVRLDPRHADAHLNLGSLAGQEGRLDEAATSFRAAIVATPTFARAHYHLGQILALQRDFRNARAEMAAARTHAEARGETALLAAIEQDLARLP